MAPFVAVTPIAAFVIVFLVWVKVSTCSRTTEKDNFTSVLTDLLGAISELLDLFFG
jgi:hypothetical protein